jgi:ABC-type transporter Mla maintaining outer membrane lipid asymmetry permease subunit MlaE
MKQSPKNNKHEDSLQQQSTVDSIYRIIDSVLHIYYPISAKDFAILLANETMQDIKTVRVYTNACNSVPTIALTNIMKKHKLDVIIEKHYAWQNTVELSKSGAQDAKDERAVNLNIFQWPKMLLVTMRANIAERKLWWKMFSTHFQYALLDNIYLVTVFFMVIGLVILWTGFDNMNRYGAGNQAGFLITVGGIDVLVPMLTNLLLVAKIGIGTASKIQYMKMQEEILALRLMLINVDKFVLNPMLCSFILTLVILTLVAVVGIVLGGYIAWIILGQSSYYFMIRYVMTISTQQILYVIIRSVIVSLVTGLITCGYGLYGGGDGNERMLNVSSKVIEYAVMSNVILQAIITYMLIDI